VKKMTKEKIAIILSLHRKWIDGDEDGARANLRGADLHDANLTYANLAYANLTGANLACADLHGANLADANLTGANLTDAYLRGAYLHDANLAGANLACADLHGANLADANLHGAYLTDAYLRGAYLHGANLADANLHGAYLTDAYLPHFQICPEEGDFVGWKSLKGGVICKVLIPAEAKRTSSLVGRKCRSEFVKVLEGEGVDRHTGKLKYAPGKIVRPDSFDDNIRVECSHGIHFFVTRREASQW